MIQSVNVDLGTIDHLKPTVLTRESEKQVSTAEDHSLGVLCLTQPPTNGEENLSLRLGYATGLRRVAFGSRAVKLRVRICFPNCSS